MHPDTLNARYALGDRLKFVTGHGGLLNAVIDNDLAVATISLYAGQVLSWRPKSTPHDVLFLSEKAWYAAGKAIKGGIPVCWPWFGPDPQGQGRPAHGFARTSEWDVAGTAQLENGTTRLVLVLSLNQETRALWPGEIEARLEIDIGDTLRLALTTHNGAATPVEVSQALHTYFAVGDIAQTTVRGLDGTTYLDKVDGGKEKVQSGDLAITTEVDRIYTGVNRDLEIHDAACRRVIHIRAEGSHSAVVWNPWQAIAARMADLDDADYLRMLCVETANAGPDVINLPGGGRHTLVAEYRVTEDRG